MARRAKPWRYGTRREVRELDTQRLRRAIEEKQEERERKRQEEREAQSRKRGLFSRARGVAQSALGSVADVAEDVGSGCRGRTRLRSAVAEGVLDRGKCGGEGRARRRQYGGEGRAHGARPSA